MRTFAGLWIVLPCMALSFAGTLLGQYHIGVPIGPGNALFPAGTSATNPSIARFTPNAVRPASGVPRSLRKPASTSKGAVIVPYAYPVYVGSGYGDPSNAPAADAQQPYPAQPAPAVASQFGPGGGQPAAGDMEPVSPYEPAPDRTADDQNSPDRYLIALKDHSVYSVVAFWVDGDTLHYFTTGNVHNQASISLVDRDVTARLNKDSGLEIELPAAK